MPRLVPARCPRCQRPFDPAAIVPTPDGLAEAGCVCGDVSRVFLDDEAPRVHAEESPPPAGWAERPRIGGWTAVYGPRAPGYGALLAALPFLLLPAARVTFHSARLLGNPGFLVGPLVTLAAFAWGRHRLARQRLGTYGFGEGRFTAARGGEAHDVPLGEILRFAVVRSASERHASFAIAVVRPASAPLLLALPGAKAEDAAFIAARLNEVLAAEGRVDVLGGYRGERLRIADDDAELPEEEISSSSRRTPRLRQRRA